MRWKESGRAALLGVTLICWALSFVCVSASETGSAAVENLSGEAAKAQAEEAGLQAGESARAGEETESEAETESGLLYEVVLVQEDGKEQEFSRLSLRQIRELTAKEQASHVYVKELSAQQEPALGQSEEDKSAKPDNKGAEDAKPKLQEEGNGLPEPITMYTRTRLNVRSLPDMDAEILEVLELADSIDVLAQEGDWYLIQRDGRCGFVSGTYVTESEEEAQQLKAEEEARLRAEAEARAQAEAQAKAQAAAKNTSKQKQTKKKKKEKTVVSKENVPSCEDPDHGTTYITYSDGSVDVVDY